MKRFRKIIYFILGWLFIPVILSFSTLFVFEFKKGIGFWSLVYLISYLIFPLLYRNTIPQRFSNRYIFYGIIYLVLLIIFLLCCFLV